MALLIPKALSGAEPQSLREFWRQLKKLPDDFQAWCSMDRGGPVERPQVLVLWKGKHAFLVQVAETSQQLAERALQGELFEEGKISPGEKERDVLVGFSRQAGEDFSSLPVHKLVVFPNVTSGTIDEIVLRRTGDDSVSYLGLRQEEMERFSRRLEAMAAAEVPAPGLIHLRKLLTPESVVPSSFNARSNPRRNTAAELDASFLDIDQEWCVKNDLELPPEQERAVSATDARLITGVAGSGKSLVLLYRAVLFARKNPGRRVLVVTHNKPLRYELQRRAGTLGPEKIKCVTFFQWARSIVGDLPGNEIHLPQMRTVIGKFRDPHPNLASVSIDYLIDEIGWMKDQGILQESQYLDAERRGRRIALRQEQKTAVWTIYRSYQRHLATHDLFDWHNIALRFHEMAIHGTAPFPAYDAIFIDEAQFFARTWFEVAQAALKPGGHLFLAADPTQGFLRRRQTWISAGIEVRGRTTRLATAYRNTRGILRYARDLYTSRHQGDDEMDLNVPDDETLGSMPVEGTPPEVIHVPSAQDEIERAVNEIAEMRSAGCPPGNVLILHADRSALKILVARLSAKLGTGAVHDAGEGMRPATAFCSVASLNAATGLEAHTVFLLGMDRLIEKEDDPRLTSGERAELIRDNTRRLYMGCTRAGRKLVIFRTRPGKPGEVAFA